MKKRFIVLGKQENKSFENLEFIEDKFSFKAFAFGIAWLFFKGLWIHAIAVTIVIGMAYDTLSENQIPVFMLLLSVAIGFSFNDWMQGKLLRSGYEYLDIILANDLEEAQYTFLQEHSEYCKPLETST